MANQNFRVKKGLEVGLGGTSLFADVSGVGIGSTAPRRELDVRGKAVIDELDVGIGSTTQAITVTGLSTFNGNMLVDGDVRITGDLEFDDALIDQLNFNVGIGTSLFVGFISAKDAEINGAGIATIGGDPEFNSISVATTSFFGGIATFASDVAIGGTLTVEGDIVLDDLDAGNITVGGTVFTDGLEFNVGIGTSLSLEDLTADEAGITTAGIGSLNVSGVSSFVGFATFGGDVAIAGTVIVGGDIVLDDLESGTIKTNQIEFNVGIGTTLIVTGISSLNIITGIGSELQYLPAGSISVSTTVGIGTTPPTERPTGEPIQQGDLWFDPISLRQFTYYSDGDSAQWVDSNPPPIQPNLRVKGEYGNTETIVDIRNEPLGIEGINDQILTVSGFGNTIRVGLETNVVIAGNLQLGSAGVLTTFDLEVGGVANINEANIGVASISNISVSGIDVDTITVDDITAEQLFFTVGIGTTLSVVDLNVSGIASLNGAGIATIGGDANFDVLSANFAQLGPTTVSQSLRVLGDLEVTSDSTFRDISVRNIDSSGVSTLPQIGFTTGIGTDLRLNTATVLATFDAELAESTLGITRIERTLFVREQATFAGFTTVQNDFSVQDNATVFGDLVVGGEIGADNISGNVVTANDQLRFTNVATGNTLTAQRIGVTTIAIEVGTASTLGVSSNLDVAGISSFTGPIEFGTAVGYALTVDELTVNDVASIPGIPLVGGAASFSSLIVTGLSTFQGITTFTDDVFIDGNLTITGVQTYSGLTGETINVTGIGTIENLVSTAASIGVASIASGFATSFNVDNLVSAAATFAGANISTAGISSLGVGFGTFFDLQVYNTIIDSEGVVGTAKSILTIDESTGKLVWDSPEGAGIATDFAPGNTFYVSVNGSNTNPGDAPTKPFATIAFALSQIPAGNNTLLVSAGEYVEVFPVGGLEVPAGLTIRGSGQRATTIRPTTGTNNNDGFRLNNATTIEDLTVAGFLTPSAGSAPYVFQLSTTADITSKSPYISRVTIANPGSVTTATDPYGYLAPLKGGNGVKIDGALVTSTSIEAAILLNEVTMFVANSVGLEMTSGARCEMVNSFIYFASQAILGEANLSSGAAGGFAGQGETRLAFNTLTATPLPSTGFVRYFGPADKINPLAEGQIVRSDAEYVYISGPGTGYFAPPTRRAAKTISFLGDAQLSTAQVPPLPQQSNPTAATSLDLTTTGSACAVDLTADFGFGTGDFTVQLWVYFPTNAYGTDIIDFRDNATGDLEGLTLSKGSGDFYEVKIGGVSVLQSAPPTALINAWQHVAISRESGTLRIFVDGDLRGSATVTDDLGIAKPLEIGADFDLLNGYEGFLADIKIDKGVAIRTSNYAIPERYLTSDIDTVLLVHFNGSQGQTLVSDDIVTFQDIRFTDIGPEVQSIRLGDYSQFGADLRSVSSAVEYGAEGIVADGQGVNLRLISINFNYIGAGGDITNDSTPNHAIEVIEQNNGNVSYVSIDQQGDFRVGDAFFVNQDTGEVSFTADVVDLTSLSSLTITDGANQSVITPTSGRFGNILVSGETIESVAGDLTLRPSGGGILRVDGDVSVAGILTAQILEINSVQNGTTSINLDEDADIRFNTNGAEAARIDDQQRFGIGTVNPQADLDVVGQTRLEDLEVTGVSTVGLISATEVQTGLVTSFQGVFQNIVVVGVATLGAGGTEGGGTTIIEGNTVITGIVTIGENSTTISGIENEEFVRAGNDTADFALMRAGNGSTTRSLFQAKDFLGEQANFTGVTTVGVLTVTGDANIAGSINITGDIDLTGGSLDVESIVVDNLETTGVTTTGDLIVTGTSEVQYLGAASIGVAGTITVAGQSQLADVNADNINITGIATAGIITTPFGFIDVLDFTSATGGSLDIDTATVGFLTATDAYIGILTAQQIEADVIIGGGTSITEDSVVVEFLSVTGVATIASAGITTLTATEAAVGFVTAQTGYIGFLTSIDVDSLSDERFKDNITPIEDALEKVIQLNGVEFDWKEGGRHSGGVIAQDVAKVLPNLVHGEEPLTVNYNGIIGALVEAVKDLKANNDALRARIEKLENS